MEPARPTQQYIEGRIAFNESGAAWYHQQGQQQLAKWSREQVNKWRAKLAEVKGREPGQDD